MGEFFDAGVQAPDDLASLLQRMQALAAYPSEAAVPIPWNDTVTIKRVLDAGARSLMFSYVRNLEEVRAAVAATRYPLQGVSDVSMTTRATRFGRIRDYPKHAHEQICLMLEFETRESLEPIEANAEIDSVEGIFIGPADLHASMGLAGESASPAVVPLIEDALRGIRKACKAPGILTSDEVRSRAATSKPDRPSLRLARTSQSLPEVRINGHPGSRPRMGGSRRPRMGKRRSGTGPTRLVDVARHASVSTASVSQAINDPHPVSPALGERVAHEARALDWVLNGAAKALASLQWRMVGAVTPLLRNPNFDWNDPIEQCVAGDKDAAAQAGLTIKPHHLAQVDGARRVAIGRLGLRQLLANPTNRPTAVICSNDYRAFGVMFAATSRGVTMSDPLSVTGVDDIDLSAHLVPALTTIRSPVDEMGEQTARYIVQVLEHGSAPLPAPLKTECVVRGSAASPTHQLRASVPTRP